MMRPHPPRVRMKRRKTGLGAPPLRARSVGGNRAAGRGELGHDEAASAEVANEAAKDGVGDSGHRGQDRGGRDADGADGQLAGTGFSKANCRPPVSAPLGCTGAAWRTEPALSVPKGVSAPPVPPELSQNFFTVLFYLRPQNEALAGARARSLN